ncbi:hypothetical protein E1B28_003573 [Marasmius oreades]|uniref:Uncharacterized protein n=1 Tax=Marasmius oreades TaxID=181124 RepID=A0A9P7RM81_9AGAR|nr:uncharacterized protein E1B28_003573 [Marasmius oreades]KAG7086052.1 hypothetical protein E1B28_003573 [Marasmius oreades]
MKGGEQEIEIYNCSLTDDVGGNDDQDDYNGPPRDQGVIRYPGVSNPTSPGPSKPKPKPR